jgi:hypothetical protein
MMSTLVTCAGGRRAPACRASGLAGWLSVSANSAHNMPTPVARIAPSAKYCRWRGYRFCSIDAGEKRNAISTSRANDVDGGAVAGPQLMAFERHRQHMAVLALEFLFG